MRTPTTFEMQTEYGFPLLEVRGRLGTQHVTEFEAQATELEDHTEDCAIIDIFGCSYITSRGFPVFISTHQRLKDRGCHLFVAVNEEVRELFSVLHLHTRLRLHASRQECVAAARACRGMIPER